jgi:regulator of sigma E protease
MTHLINFLFHFIRFSIFVIINIILHESGHLLVAKKCGCGVDIFSIGFGKPFYRKEYRETIYQISFLLLGGYCKLRDELTNSSDKTAFSNQSYYKKVLISIAGCLTNIILGIIFCIIGSKLLNFNMFYFGIISLSLGITNLLPLPALDGSYPILVWLEKFYGKEKGYKMMEKICRIGFIILMTINILYLPYLFYLLWKGVL